MDWRSVREVTCHSILTIEPFHNLHLGKFELVKKCTVSCLSPERLRTAGCGEEKNRLSKCDHGYTASAIGCIVLPGVIFKCQKLVWTFRKGRH